MPDIIDLNTDFERITGLEEEDIKELAIFALLPFISEEILDYLDLAEKFQDSTNNSLFEVLERLSDYPELVKGRKDASYSIYRMEAPLSNFLLSKIDRKIFTEKIKELYNIFYSFSERTDISVTPKLARQIFMITNFLSFIYFFNMQDGERTNIFEVDFAHNQFTSESTRLPWVKQLFSQSAVEEYFSSMQME